MQTTAQQTTPQQYDALHWLKALDAANAALAQIRPSRSSYSSGPFGEDCYQFAVEAWEIRQSKARRLHKLATQALAALQ